MTAGFYPTVPQKTEKQALFGSPTHQNDGYGLQQNF
jgi:hypothetical protein